MFAIASRLIKEFEGLVLSPYFCTAKVVTIGYGDVIDQDEMYGVHRGVDIINLSEHFLMRNNNKTFSTNAELKRHYGEIITKDEASLRLEKEIRIFWQGFSKLLPHGLTDNQCAVLLSFVYNVGIQNFKNSTLLKLLREGEILKASKQFRRWIHADGRIDSGLMRRRKIEADIFLS